MISRFLIGLFLLCEVQASKCPPPTLLIMGDYKVPKFFHTRDANTNSLISNGDIIKLLEESGLEIQPFINHNPPKDCPLEIRLVYKRRDPPQDLEYSQDLNRVSKIAFAHCLNPALDLKILRDYKDLVKVNQIWLINKEKA